MLHRPQHVEAQIGGEAGEPELFTPHLSVRHVGPAVAGEHHLETDIHRAPSCAAAVWATPRPLAARERFRAEAVAEEIVHLPGPPPPAGSECSATLTPSACPARLAPHLVRYTEAAAQTLTQERKDGRWRRAHGHRSSRSAIWDGRNFSRESPSRSCGRIRPPS